MLMRAFHHLRADGGGEEVPLARFALKGLRGPEDLVDQIEGGAVHPAAIKGAGLGVIVLELIKENLRGGQVGIGAAEQPANLAVGGEDLFPCGQTDHDTGHATALCPL